MARAQRLTRRSPAQMTEAGYCRLSKCAEEARLDEGEVPSFLFENFENVTNADNLSHRLELHRQILARRKDETGA